MSTASPPIALPPVAIPPIAFSPIVVPPIAGTPADPPTGPRSVVVFGSRETAGELRRTLKPLLAVRAIALDIAVLCNGRADLPLALRAELQQAGLQAGAHRLRLWHIDAADKANAFNQHLTSLWSGQGPAFYLDGHCRIDEAALLALDAALQRPDAPLAASAVPSRGRTAERRRDEMLQQGGLVGEFLGISAATLARLRRRRIRLPLGLYGFDALLGAMFGYDLDPRHQAWALRERVAVCPHSTWVTEPKRWWHLQDLRQQGQRRLRIALRKMVNAALHTHFTEERRLPEHLPRTCRELVDLWATAQPEAFSRLLVREPLAHIALQRLRQPRDWSPAAIEPRLVFDSAGPVGLGREPGAPIGAWAGDPRAHWMRGLA